MRTIRRAPHVGGLLLIAAACWLYTPAGPAAALDAAPLNVHDQEPVKAYKPAPAEPGAGDTKAPVAENSLRFAVLGDTGTGDRAQYDVGAQLARSRQVFPFEFVIMVGDNMYGGERPQDFIKKFELPYKAILAQKISF